MLSPHHCLVCLDTWPQLVALFREGMEPLGWVAQQEVGCYSEALKALSAAGSHLSFLLLGLVPRELPHTPALPV